jgi:hypothetical protein
MRAGDCFYCASGFAFLFASSGTLELGRSVEAVGSFMGSPDGAAVDASVGLILACWRWFADADGGEVGAKPSLGGPIIGEAGAIGTVPGGVVLACAALGDAGMSAMEMLSPPPEVELDILAKGISWCSAIPAASALGCDL